MEKIVEHFTMIIIAGLLGLIICLLLENNSQQKQFMNDREFYYSGMINTLSGISVINSKLDFQTATIQKTIDDQFNNINCTIGE